MTTTSVVLERNTVAQRELITEPYEAGWASEGIFFVHTLDELRSDWTGRLQISPDGLHWCDLDESERVLARTGVTAFRARHFGTWLRLVLTTDDAGDQLRCLVTFSGKGPSW